MLTLLAREQGGGATTPESSPRGDFELVGWVVTMKAMLRNHYVANKLTCSSSGNVHAYACHDHNEDRDGGNDS